MESSPKYGILADIVKTKIFEKVKKELNSKDVAVRTMQDVKLAFSILSEKCTDSADFLQILADAYYPGAKVLLSQVEITVAGIDAVINTPYITCEEIPSTTVLKYLSNYDCGAVLLDLRTLTAIWQANC